jgi:hypothetical protein
LQLIAVARYSGDLRAGMSTVLYLVFLILVLATGTVGALFTLSLRRPASAMAQR